MFICLELKVIEYVRRPRATKHLNWRALQQQLMYNSFIEQYLAIWVDKFKKQGLRNSLHRLYMWCSNCYILNSWYVFLIVTDILENESLCLNICFMFISPLLNFEFLDFIWRGWVSLSLIKNTEGFPCCSCLSYSETKQL